MPEQAKDVAEIEQQLRGRAHNTAIAALEVVPFAMLIADGSAGALAVNSKWMDISGLGRPESLGSGWLDALDTEARYRLREDVLQVADTGDGTTVDYQLGSGPGRRWARWWVSRHELDGIPLVAIAVADIEDDYARQESLYHLATHDSLTGLVNRSHFLEAIEQALLRGQRQSRHVAVVYVDLDGFKRVNDQGGHSLGDRVLFAIAARLRHAVRAADTVARIGGDEFAVLCEGLSAIEQADVVARRIAVALTESVELDGERWSVAASVGAAIDRGVGDPDSAEDLVDRADRAMYSIKLTRRRSDQGGERVEARRAAPQSPPPAGSARAVDTGYYDESAEPHRQPRPAPAAAGEGRRAEPDVGHAESEGRLAEREGHRAAEPEARRAEGEGRRATEPEVRRTAEPEYFGGRQPDVAVLDPEDARRALRDLAEAAGAFEQPTEMAASRAEADPARRRLATDVVHLRESIDSIRRMLDRILTSESGIIDIRDPQGRYERR